jgi:hydrogenase maturation protease
LITSGDQDPAEDPEAPETARGQIDPRCARVGHRLLIGVGNPFRGDDGAGRAVARLVASRNACGLVACECTGEATSLMSAWTGYDDVVVVDACRGAGPPGSIHRFGPDDVERVATLQHASTHSLGVAAAIGLARALGTLPGHLVLYAIEAGHSGDGEALSPEVDRSVQEVVAFVMHDAHV